MFSILPSIVACYFFIIGWLVLKKSNKQRAHLAFALLCFTTFVWQSTWSILFQVSDPEAAMLLIKFGYLIICFLPTSLYHFLIEVSGAHQERKYVYASYTLCILLASALVSGNWLISGYYEYYWGYYPKAGPLHPLHVLQTAVVVLRGLYIAYQQLKTSPYPLREQLRYCISGLLIYTFAAIDYACNYGLELYPPGIVFITAGLTIIAYALSKKELLDIHLIIPRWGAHIITGLLVVFSFAGIHFLAHQSPALHLTLSLFAALAWAKYGDILRLKLQTTTEQRWIRNWYEPNQVTNLLIQRLQPLLNKRDIVLSVAQTLSDTLGSRQGDVLVREGNYFTSHSQSHHSLSLLDKDHPQLEFLAHNPYQPIGYNEIPGATHETSVINCPHDSILLPLHSSATLEGIIILRGRISTQTLTTRDRQFLSTLTRQTDVFLDRAEAHRKLMAEAVAEQERRITLTKAIAGNIAHELRTPLTTISMTVKALENHWTPLWRGYELGKKSLSETKQTNITLLSPRHEMGIRDAINSIDRATRLSQTIITMLMENVQNEKINTADFNLYSAAHCIQKALQDYPFQEHEASITHFDSRHDFEFFGSGTLLIYVIYNLLKNALYYIAKANKGDVNIWLETCQTNNQIHFRDSGSGIAQEVMQHMFEPFYTTKPSGVGNGLGLPFCQRVIQSFNGRISCHSEFGVYTEFVITLPKPVAPIDRD